MTGYPFPCRNWISLLQLVESANAPCTSTIVGLAADAPLFVVLLVAVVLLVVLFVVLASAAPPPASTAAATSGTAKARVSFIIGTLPS